MQQSDLNDFTNDFTKSLHFNKLIQRYNLRMNDFVIDLHINVF